MIKKLLSAILVLTFALQSTNAYALRSRSASQSPSVVEGMRGEMHNVVGQGENDGKQISGAMHEGLGEEFDNIVKEAISREKLFEIKFTDSLANYLKEITIVEDTIVLAEGTESGDRVYYLWSTRGANADEFLVFIDESGNIRSLAVRGGTANTKVYTKEGLLRVLPNSVYPIFAEKINPILKKIKAKQLKIQDKRFETYDITKEEDGVLWNPRERVFLPLINIYYGLPELRNDFINNAILRNLIRKVGPKTFLAHSGMVRYIRDKNYAFSMGGETWYNLEKSVSRYPVLPLLYQEKVAHEISHELYYTLSPESLKELLEYFSEQRNELMSIIRSFQGYADLDESLQVSEVIARLVGNLTNARLWWEISDANIRLPIKIGDIDILIKHGFLPDELKADAKERARFEKNSGSIDIRYLARVYPQTKDKIGAKELILIEEAAENEKHSNQISGAMHEGKNENRQGAALASVAATSIKDSRRAAQNEADFNEFAGLVRENLKRLLSPIDVNDEWLRQQYRRQIQIAGQIMPMLLKSGLGADIPVDIRERLIKTMAGSVVKEIAREEDARQFKKIFPRTSALPYYAGKTQNWSRDAADLWELLIADAAEGLVRTWVDAGRPMGRIAWGAIDTKVKERLNRVMRALELEEKIDKEAVLEDIKEFFEKDIQQQENSLALHKMIEFRFLLIGELLKIMQSPLKLIQLPDSKFLSQSSLVQKIEFSPSHYLGFYVSLTQAGFNMDNKADRRMLANALNNSVEFYSDDPLYSGESLQTVLMKSVKDVCAQKSGNISGAMHEATTDIVDGEDVSDAVVEVIPFRHEEAGSIEKHVIPELEKRHKKALAEGRKFVVLMEAGSVRGPEEELADLQKIVTKYNITDIYALLTNPRYTNLLRNIFENMVDAPLLNFASYLNKSYQRGTMPSGRPPQYAPLDKYFAQNRIDVRYEDADFEGWRQHLLAFLEYQTTERALKTHNLMEFIESIKRQINFESRSVQARDSRALGQLRSLSNKGVAVVVIRGSSHPLVYEGNLGFVIKSQEADRSLAPVNQIMLARLTKEQLPQPEDVMILQSIPYFNIVAMLKEKSPLLTDIDASRVALGIIRRWQRSELERLFSLEDAQRQDWITDWLKRNATAQEKRSIGLVDSNDIPQESRELVVKGETAIGQENIDAVSRAINVQDPIRRIEALSDLIKAVHSTTGGWSDLDAAVAIKAGELLKQQVAKLEKEGRALWTIPTDAHSYREGEIIINTKTGELLVFRGYSSSGIDMATGKATGTMLQFARVGDTSHSGLNASIVKTGQYKVLMLNDLKKVEPTEISGAMHEGNFAPKFEDGEETTTATLPTAKDARVKVVTPQKFEFIVEDLDSVGKDSPGVKVVKFEPGKKIQDTAKSFTGLDQVDIKDKDAVFLYASNVLEGLDKRSALESLSAVTQGLKDRANSAVILVATEKQEGKLEQLKEKLAPELREKVIITDKEHLPGILRFLSGMTKIYYRTENDPELPGAENITITEDILNKIGAIMQNKEQFEEFKQAIVNLLQA